MLGALFTMTHLIKPRQVQPMTIEDHELTRLRKLGDHTYLSWNNDQPSATATGRDGGHQDPVSRGGGEA